METGTSLQQSEQALRTPKWDFAGRYLALGEIQSHLRDNGGEAASSTVEALECLLQNRTLDKETQSFFLYREAAGILAALIQAGTNAHRIRQSASVLKRILHTSEGAVHRAASEALGALPLAVEGPSLPLCGPEAVPRISWSRLLNRHGLVLRPGIRSYGRSAAADLRDEGRILVVKWCRRDASPGELEREAVWMHHLASGGYPFQRRFDIPRPLAVEGRYLFRLEDAPQPMVPAGIHAEQYAIVFVAHRDYFLYPNSPANGSLPPHGEFREIMARTAWLLGRLAGRGIVHSAPIPLFHNRIQRQRRADRGRYEWARGGRLDRWLASTRHPNFGATGLRDFEHLLSLTPRERLYPHIGMQILSLLLVAGSYFRNRDPSRIGLRPDGTPEDARDLFDPILLEKVVQSIFRSYYEGFVGTEPREPLPIDVPALCARMIDEMGVDRHMEEILRVQDQQAMDPAEFRRFLLRRGVSEEKLSTLKQGVQDITLFTGPHLGGFNERISLPELIRAVAVLAAVCTLDRFLLTRSCPGESRPAPASDFAHHA